MCLFRRPERALRSETRYVPRMIQGDSPGVDWSHATDGIGLARPDLFLATLAHELRGPLAPLRNSLAVLRLAHPDPQAVAQLIEIMDRQVTQLAALLDGLLDLERLESGFIHLHTRTIDFTRLVAQSVNDRRMAFDDKGVALVARLDTGPVWVDGDPVRLQQIVTELLGNALGFTSAGGSVHVELEKDPVHGQAVLRVRDTGAGFTQEELPYLSAPFRTGTTRESDVGTGLGLGLAIVQALAALHHADVSAHSDGPGRGAEFTFTIGLADPP